MLVVDAANVVGSRPNGWWRDRPGAARQLVARIRVLVAAGELTAPVLVVLEGAARGGVAEGVTEGVEVVHALGSGDDTIVALVAEAEVPVVVVSSDRGLRRRVEDLDGEVVKAGWLLDRLGV
jgi:hypothetical protein